MTTITYRDGVLASDSRETSTNGEVGDDGYVVNDRCKKVYRLPDGRLFAAAHATEDGERLLLALRNNQTPPALEDVCALLINHDGTVLMYEGHIWIKQHGPYFAIGSGARFALGAMKVGASAVKAATVGAAMDPYSGGPIQVLKLRRKRRASVRKPSKSRRTATSHRRG